MTKNEALKLALDFIENSEGGTADLEAHIKEALAQQEPVCDKDPQGCWNVRCQLGKKCKNTPPQRTWVGLTKNEVETLSYQTEGNTWKAVELAEAKLKEKNK